MPLYTRNVETVDEVRQSELLQPYVPRLVIDWLLDDPDRRWRAVDGTLTFVDISGFTQLTERLAGKGKVGAEELNDTLDVCFTELLSAAYEYGAELVKWGGDAVLLLFEGDEHAPRAARAAAANAAEDARDRQATDLRRPGQAPHVDRASLRRASTSSSSDIATASS